MALPTKKKEEKVEHFIRLVRLGHQKPGDQWEAFQPEVITVRGNMVLSRKMLDKPNLFEFAYAVAADCIDPRNERLYEKIA